MKKPESPLQTRVMAFLVLVVFSAVSCYLPPAPDTPRQPADTPKTGKTPPGKDPAPPVSFYLSSDYLPVEADHGVTAFMLPGNPAAESFIVMSEEGIPADETDTGIVVRFLDGKTDTVVALYFADTEEAPFPQNFVMSSGGSDTYGFFSPYDVETETFSVTLQAGPQTRTFSGITLNKNVLTAYQDDPEQSDGWNARMRGYTAALGVWTAMALFCEKELEAYRLAAVLNGNADPNHPDWYLSAEAGEAIMNAVETVVSVGVAVATFFVQAFSTAVAVVELVGLAVGVTVSAPVTMVIAAVAGVVATAIVESAPPHPGNPAPEIPLAQRNAPLFSFYYLDDAGNKQQVPVTRAGETPELAKTFYIPPHNRSLRYTSNVRFYFQVGRSSLAESAADIPTADYNIVEQKPDSMNGIYQAVATGHDGEGDYIEIKKQNGYWGETTPDRHTQLVVKVYDGNKADKPAYPYFYVNGVEFTDAEEFVINFFDYVTEEEESQVVIPPCTVAQSEAVNGSMRFIFLIPFIQETLPHLYTYRQLKQLAEQNIIGAVL
jgi:hypothetical protein